MVWQDRICCRLVSLKLQSGLVTIKILIGNLSLDFLIERHEKDPATRIRNGKVREIKFQGKFVRITDNQRFFHVFDNFNQSTTSL